MHRLIINDLYPGQWRLVINPIPGNKLNVRTEFNYEASIIAYDINNELTTFANDDTWDFVQPICNKQKIEIDINGTKITLTEKRGNIRE